MASYTVKLYFRSINSDKYSVYSGSLKHFLLHKDFVKTNTKLTFDNINLISKLDDSTFNQDYLNQNNFVNQTFYTNDGVVEIDTDEPELYNNLGLIWRSCNCQSNVIVYMYSLHLIA
jgi:hypothetical protein